MIEKKKMPKNIKLTSEWDTLEIDNHHLIGCEHIRWIDMDKRDWCNDQIWETIWEKPITEELTKRLLHYSNLIQDNYRNLNIIDKQLSEFESLIAKELLKYI